MSSFEFPCRHPSCYSPVRHVAEPFIEGNANAKDLENFEHAVLAEHFFSFWPLTYAT